MNHKEETEGNIICVRANGAIEVMPADEDVFEQAKFLLDGARLEVVQTVIPNLVMLVHKNKLSGNFSINWQATEISVLSPQGSDEIFGDVVLVDKRGEDLCALKNSGYVEKVLKFMLQEEGAS